LQPTAHAAIFRGPAVTLRVYDPYCKYLTGCAGQFRKGTIDVMQFCMRRE